MAALLEKPAFLVLLMLVMLLFGAKRLPELARGVGRSLRVLKAETSALTEDPRSPGISATSAGSDGWPVDEADAQRSESA